MVAWVEGLLTVFTEPSFKLSRRSVLGTVKLASG